jgi:putative transposase
LRKKKENENEKMIAFDPGIRTFQTGFDSDENFVKYGEGKIEKIILLAKKMDRSQSKIDQHYLDSYSSESEKKYYKNLRRKWRRQMGRISFKIKNLKKDIHWKISKDIVQHYKHVFIPRFRVSGMIEKRNRNIGSETVRKLLNWNHFEFRRRLKHKAEEFRMVVHEVGEHYSSKGCGQCGRIHWKLGSSKWFHCPHCHFKIDRDFNGARNILIMNLASHCYLNSSLS